jgi:hypothetical protein
MPEQVLDVLDLAICQLSSHRARRPC